MIAAIIIGISGLAFLVCLFAIMFAASQDDDWNGREG